jgi:uncharacterized protein
MRVVVAGGSGLIGRHLVGALVERGDSAVVLSRRPERARRGLPPAAEVVGWRPGSGAEPLVELLRGADGVVNLAGESVGHWPWTAATKRAIRDSRLITTREIVEAIAALPAADRPLVLVNASGSDMYEHVDAEPATEDGPIAGDSFLARVCLDWEEEALRAQALGTRVVLLRTTLVLARGAPALERLLLPFRLFAGGRLGSGDQWQSWIAIEDAVGLILHALRSWDVSGPLNLAAPQEVRQRDFARLAGRVLRRPAWLNVPARLVRLALGEQATLALGSRRVWPAKALRSGYEFVVPRLDEALARAAR